MEILCTGLVLCFVAVLVILMVQHLRDVTGMEELEGFGVITGFKHVEGGYDFILEMPEYPSWSIRVRVDDQETWFNVNEDTFNRFADGDRINVKYGYGRMSGRLHILDIWTIENGGINAV